MEIDIEPVLKQATETERICIVMREIDCLYVVKTPDGSEFTVQWDKKKLKEFQPRRTVSEMLNTWEEGNQRQYDMYIDAIKNNIHPWFKDREEIMHHIVPNLGTGKFKDVDRPLTNSEKAYFKRASEELKPKLGKLTFIKITHLLNDKGQEINKDGLTLEQFTKQLYEEMIGFGLPVSSYKKKYFFKKYTKEEVLAKGWFTGIETPKSIASRLNDNFNNAWEIH